MTDFVELDDALFPTMAEFGWAAFVGALASVPEDADERMRAFYDGYGLSGLTGLVTHAPRHDRRYITWVWDHNGAGDFVRISSRFGGKRWLVGFNHESSRSPYGLQNGEGNSLVLPSGLQWLSEDYELAFIRNSDQPSIYNIPAVTEVCFRRTPYKFEKDQRVIWRTSPEVAALNINYRDREIYDVQKYAQESGEPLSEHEQLYVDLVAGKRPTLQHLVALTRSETIASAAFLAIRYIDAWLDENEHDW